MNKSKYIYIIGRTANYDGEGFEEIIKYASTDFEDVIERIDYRVTFLRDELYVISNGASDAYLYEINLSTKNVIEYFDKYTPDIFIENKDEDEIAYVKLHLERWCNARANYLTEKANKELKEKQKKEEERDRKEYERLKQKYGSSQET